MGSALVRRLGDKSHPFALFCSSRATDAGAQTRGTAAGREYFGEVCSAIVAQVLQVQSTPSAPMMPTTNAQRAIQAEVASLIESLQGALVDGDVLKPLYRNLLPRRLRHERGEFYTPDWLAELTLERSGYCGQLDARIVDSMCGSGTFVMLCLRKLRATCRGAGLSGDQTLSAILKNICGMDRDSFATAAARANMLLGIRDLLKAGNQVRLPIYDCDAMDAAADQASLFGASDALALPLDRSFDFVVGNPPWVGWETQSLSDRRRTMTMWRRYGLFSSRGMDAILGKGRKELATLLSQVAADRLLKVGGTLAFVMPKLVFKSGAAEGFRRFRLGNHADSEPVAVRSVDDLSDMQPFPDAATKTTVMVWTKGNPTTYPLPYRIWQTLQPIRSIAERSLDEIRAITRQLECVARPRQVSRPTSPWLTATERCLLALAPLAGPSQYRAYEGVNTGGANGILWVDKLSRLSDGAVRIRNLATAGKRVISELTADIESELLYPILRGIEVGRWRASPTAFVLLVQDVERRRGIDIDVMARDFPRTLQYLRHFEAPLRARRMYVRYFGATSGKSRAHNVDADRAPFYSMFNVGPYTLAPFKVVWHRMVTPFQAAVVGSRDGKPVLPQETHAFIPCATAEEAHFLAGLLNSTPFEVAALVGSDGGSKGFAGPHLVEQIALPRFNAKDDLHIELARLARRANELASNDGVELRDHASKVNAAAGLVWRLTASQCAALEDFRAQITKADLASPAGVYSNVSKILADSH